MRITIEQKEKSEKGWFKAKTYYVVRCKVDFSEEELQIIKDRELGQDVVLERPPSCNLKVSEFDDPRQYYLYVDDLVQRADNYACPTPFDAKEYERELEVMLRKMKAYIDQNASLDGGSRTFEL